MSGDSASKSKRKRFAAAASWSKRDDPKFDLLRTLQEGIWEVEDYLNIPPPSIDYSYINPKADHKNEMEARERIKERTIQKPKPRVKEEYPVPTAGKIFFDFEQSSDDEDAIPSAKKANSTPSDIKIHLIVSPKGKEKKRLSLSDKSNECIQKPVVKKEKTSSESVRRSSRRSNSQAKLPGFKILLPKFKHAVFKLPDFILTDTEQEEQFQTRPSIKLSIPDSIKAILVDDWENVTKNNQLVPLPAAKPVNVILDEYLLHEKPNRQQGSAEGDLLEEVVAGLKEYFEKCLGRILLYRYVLVSKVIRESL